jgi:hypothetical protein
VPWRSRPQHQKQTSHRFAVPPMSKVGASGTNDARSTIA